jgi:hypothetical protein
MSNEYDLFLVFVVVTNNGKQMEDRTKTDIWACPCAHNDIVTNECKARNGRTYKE